MIDRREIIDTASKLSLNPHVVEKDFVLGWVLAGIDWHEALAGSWIFKGGTCLKKCYFETYRFSEDLDFTLTDASHIDEAFLQRVFAEIADWVYEQAGIELPHSECRFEIYANPRGKPSCQGRLSYRGPVSPSAGGLPRLKLDLSADEVLVRPPVRVQVFHPYSDAPDGGIHVLSYAYEEAFGEKIRALAERTRPRDLYDVINLFRNADARPSPSALLNTLKEKCAFKGIAVPTLADLEPHRLTLEGAWASMLGHQLPALPPMDTFWGELPLFFQWLQSGRAPIVQAAYASAPGETLIRDRSLRLPVSAGIQSHVEIIRFAASNRLCVDLDYQGSTRRIEPYSLRRTQDGQIVLHAVRAADGENRSYRVDRIAGARATEQTFVPRYEIELTPQGPVHVAPVAGRGSRLGYSAPRTPRAARARRRATGPMQVYECSLCRKRFYRKARTPELRPHKNKNGYSCSGRHAIWVGTRR